MYMVFVRSERSDWLHNGYRYKTLADAMAWGHNLDGNVGWIVVPIEKDEVIVSGDLILELVDVLTLPVQ